jgi:hypothetical protein
MPRNRRCPLEDISIDTDINVETFVFAPLSIE